MKRNYVPFPCPASALLIKAAMKANWERTMSKIRNILWFFKSDILSKFFRFWEDVIILMLKLRLSCHVVKLAKLATVTHYVLIETMLDLRNISA